MLLAVVIEEIAKSLTVAVAIEHRLVKRWFQVLTLALVIGRFLLYQVKSFCSSCRLR